LEKLILTLFFCYQYGKQLWENYRTLMEDLAHEDLDRFGRSVSLACMPQQNSNQSVMIPQNDSQQKTNAPLRQISQENGQTLEMSNRRLDHSV
jgi:hypothetical protein